MFLFKSGAKLDIFSEKNYILVVKCLFDAYF